MRSIYRFEGLHSSAGHCWQIGGRWLELGQSGFYLEVFPLSRRPGSDRPCVCGSQNYLALRVDDAERAYAAAIAVGGNEIDLPDSVGRIWRGEPIQMELGRRPPLLARIGFVAGPGREIIELLEITKTARGIMDTQAKTTKVMKLPGPDHPITIHQNSSRVIVTVGGRVIADTNQALTLREATLPSVQYIPRGDVDMSQLERTDHATYCPYKGDCAYYSIPAGGERSRNAVWTYEAPYAAVAEIKDHLAFYPDRVDTIQEISQS
jgi:uncharacterized protein (DUF427 family)